MSFPISLEKDQVYTLSFSAKADPSSGRSMFRSAVRHGVESSSERNGPWGDTWNPESKFRITPEWNRYSRTFTADAGGVQIGLFGCGGNTLIDGIQIEKGRQPTEFTAAPVDGVFTTSDPDNDLVRGAPLNAGFTFSGKPGTAGRVNVLRQKRFPGSALDRLHRRPGSEKRELGKSDFRFRRKRWEKGFLSSARNTGSEKNAPYFDYYRFSIMTPAEKICIRQRTFSEPSDITTASPGR